LLRFLVGCCLAGFSSGTLACDAYTSTSKEPGTRILKDDFSTSELTITEAGKTIVYEKSAGTFRGFSVAWDPITHETYEIGFDEEGRYIFGGERFVEYCK
jgi:hypothetical protein